MWVIPKNLRIYPSAQDTGALISDSQELSDLLEQSVLWRSKPSASKTWSRRLKVGGSTPRLFSQTLKLSHGESLLDEWISSQEASLVSHSQPQDEKSETKTQDTSGLTLFEEFERWKDLPLFSSKMLKVSSPQSSSPTDGQTLKEQVFCTMSSESWKDWVTKQRQEYSVRVKSAHPTKENVSSFWVVAPISESQGAILFQGCSKEQRQEPIWPTPKALEVDESVDQWAKRREKPAAKKRGSSLTVAVKMWNTPSARDYKGVDWNREARGYNPSLPNQAVQSTPHLEAQNSTLGNPQESQWATPQARDYKGSNRRAVEQDQIFSQSLPMQVEESKTWSTPTTRDYKGMYPQWIQEDPNRQTRHLLPDQVHGGSYKGRLNPRWVETLMGLPLGWVMPSCANPWTIIQMNSDSLETE